MVNVDEALDIITHTDVQYNKIESVKLQDSLNRILADNVYSNLNIPAQNNSAMDGYALRSEDTKGISKKFPKIFKIIGESKAGFPSKNTLDRNEAIRIMTGALIPQGADSVMIIENTEEEGEFVKIFDEIESGTNIRKLGEDIKAGDLVLKRRTRLKPAHMGQLASLGFSSVKVVAKPKVGIISTGDEILDTSEEIEDGKLYDSNTYSLLGQIIEIGAEPLILGIAKDNHKELLNKLEISIRNDCDIILLSGGVSVGKFDFVKDVFKLCGIEIEFWKVLVKPGKPLLFGKKEQRLFFGLPGNPVSAMVTFEVFVRPVIMKMLGIDGEERTEMEAILEEDIHKKKGIRVFLRGITIWNNGIYKTRTTGPQGSGILTSMAKANSLIILSEESELIRKGTPVRVRLLFQI